MTTTELIQEIRTYCMANADAERLKKTQHYFKEEFVGYGLTAPQVHSKVKEMLKSERLNLPMVLDAAPRLMESGQYEEISFALLLLNGLWKQFTARTFQTIETWFPISIRNWAHADTLGMFILPRFLDKKIMEMKAYY